MINKFKELFAKVKEYEVKCKEVETDHSAWHDAWHDLEVDDENTELLNMIESFDLQIINGQILPHGYNQDSDYWDYEDELEDFRESCHDMMEQTNEEARFYSREIKELAEELEELFEQGLEIDLENFEFAFFQYAKKINVPEGIKAIKENDFNNIKSLDVINLPSTLEEISNDFFSVKCSEINISNNKYFKSVDGVLYDKEFKKLLRYPSNKKMSEFTILSSIETIGVSAFEACSSGVNLVVPSSVKVIEKSAFERCELKVVLSEGLEILGDFAFYCSRNVNFKSIPTSVKHIGKRAFDSCYPLVNLRLHEGLESIGAYAFFDAYNILAVEIPTSVKTIGECAFNTKEIKVFTKVESKPVGWNDKFIDGKIIVNYGCDYFDPKECSEFEDVVLPEGMEVISESFFKNSLIRSVVIPNSVIEIKESAFENCINLEEVKFTNDLVNLSKSSFRMCEKLNNVIVPKELKELPDFIFEKCNSLTNVVLPNGLKKIGVGSFQKCKSLKNIELPESIVEIKTQAFNDCEALESIVLPKKVKILAGSAFQRCSNLKEVILSDKIRTIYSFTFNECVSLTNISLPKDIVSIEKSAFQGCSNLKEIVIPDLVEEICEYTFNYCTLLEKVSLPSKLKKISKVAFQSCANLKEIIMPNSVEELEEGVFQACSKLEKVVLSNKITYLPRRAFNTCKSLKEIELPSNITSLDEFSLNCGIEKIFIPKEVKTISDKAFYGSTTLKEIIVDKDNENFESLDGVLYTKGLTYIKSYPKAKETTVFEIPTEVKSASEEVFDNCKNLIKVVINSNFEVLPSWMFESCTNLEEVVISEGVKVFRNAVFRNCSKLKSIPLPTTLTKIDEYCFDGCTSLETICLPENLSTIGTKLFLNGCDLKSITVDANNKYFIEDNGIVYSTDGKTIYLYANGSKTTDLVLNDGVETIKSFAFYAVKNLESISIPKSVTNIESSAISANMFMKSFNVDANNKTYKSIDGNLYSNDGSKLIAYALGKKEEVFTVNSSVVTICEDSFFSAVNLKEVIIEDGTNTIEEFAFQDCKNLVSIKIPKSVKRIKNKAFLDVNKNLIMYFENFARCSCEPNFNPSACEIKTY